jgi:hypothetical protein
MTYLEKLKLDHPSWDDEGIIEGRCPNWDFDVETPHYCNSDDEDCEKCWNREIPGTECTTETVTSADVLPDGNWWPTIRDSGDRREFSTGAVRDMAEGKGDMISMPWEALLRLSKHYEAGAKKYNRWNYRKGIPVSSFIDSACRHLAKYQCGMDDEDHLAAAAFNVLGAMLMENTMPDMQDLPAREGKKTFSYVFEEET